VLGVDLDGFMWARRRALPFVASLKGIIADELRNERGWVRTLLSVQARWERRNVERADLVVVTSRYSAEVARREYGVPVERLAVVPEPIDLEVWDDQFWRAPRRPGNGPVVLSVARM
jgi:glycosyltransferase involved in cell wall biosynthesis